MSAIVTNKFRFSNAETFYDSFATDRYYLFIGRSEPWADDNAPPAPDDTIVSEHKVYRDMISAKKVSTADVVFVIERRNWTTGTTYDVYHHNVTQANPSTSGATNLWDSTFYVINSNYNVYICIDNNGGIASSIEPTGVLTTVITTSDGYKWKYLYTVSSSDVQKFLSLDFMPVSDNADVVSTAATLKGAIQYVKIISGGSGYTNGSYTKVIHGDGSGGTVNLVVSGGSITSATINATGTGYTFASLDLTAEEDVNVTTVAPNIDLVISPSYGHGGDNKKELGAFFVMMNATIVGAEGGGDFLVNQDFRQVGVVKNPTKGGSSSYSDSTLSGLKEVTVTGTFTTTPYVVDELIVGGSSTTDAIGVVADFNASTGLLKYFQQSEIGAGLASDGDIDAFASGETIDGQTSGATGTAAAAPSNAEIDVYTGDIVYVENRMPISRATDQQENIKLIVEF